jgi:hypothetical protein
MKPGVIYLINHVSAETLTTGWMIPSGTTGWMIPSGTTGWMIPSGTNSPSAVIVIRRTYQI